MTSDSKKAEGEALVRWALDVERLVEVGTADSGRHKGKRMFELHEDGQFYKLVYVCCKRNSSGDWFDSIFRTESEAKNSAEGIAKIFNREGF